VVIDTDTTTVSLAFDSRRTQLTSRTTAATFDYEGDVFRATYDEDTGTVTTTEVGRARESTRGSHSRPPDPQSSRTTPNQLPVVPAGSGALLLGGEWPLATGFTNMEIPARPRSGQPGRPHIAFQDGYHSGPQELHIHAGMGPVDDSRAPGCCGLLLGLALDTADCPHICGQLAITLYVRWSWSRLYARKLPTATVR